jgi:DNA modification methylase
MGMEDMINKVICGDALTVLKSMDSNYFNCCVTSPPY